MNWRDIPIPKKMRALECDRRGYPIPFIILRDTDGRPHFTINDSTKQTRCIREKRCPICGSKLDRLLWFVGGPLSAFHPDGAYIDSALHHECMTYALQVCPYLAAPNYLGRIDTGTIDHDKVPSDVQIMVDPTIIPERPSPFVCVASYRQTITELPTTLIGLRVAPVRPYVHVEFWDRGQRIPDDAGTKLAMDRVSSYIDEQQRKT